MPVGNCKFININTPTYKSATATIIYFLDIVLKCGQSFRWSQYDSQSFIGVMSNILWLLNQTNDEIRYKTIGKNNANARRQILFLFFSVFDTNDVVNRILFIYLFFFFWKFLF